MKEWVEKSRPSFSQILDIFPILDKITQPFHILYEIYQFLMLFVGKQKTLYMSNVKSIEEATRPNLKKSLRELGLESGCEVIVADVTTPQPLTFKLNFD